MGRKDKDTPSSKSENNYRHEEWKVSSNQRMINLLLESSPSDNLIVLGIEIIPYRIIPQATKPCLLRYLDGKDSLLEHPREENALRKQSADSSSIHT